MVHYKPGTGWIDESGTIQKDSTNYFSWKNHYLLYAKTLCNQITSELGLKRVTVTKITNKVNLWAGLVLSGKGYDVNYYANYYSIDCKEQELAHIYTLYLIADKQANPIKTFDMLLEKYQYKGVK